MTLPNLIKSLTSLREIFPREVQMKWSMADYLTAAKEQEERTLAALDRWKEENDRRGIQGYHSQA